MSPLGTRRRHGDDERLGGAGFGRRLKHSRRDDASDQLGKVRLGDMDLTAVDRLDDPGVDIEADDAQAARRHHRGCRQTDVAEAHDTDVG